MNDPRIAPAENGCLVWTGARVRGYGWLYRDGKAQYAHRYFWSLVNGPIPDGLQIDHLCRNKPCVNPAHLEPVTMAENIRRYRVARTHCRRGHEVTPENIAYEQQGGCLARRCLPCRRDRWPKYADRDNARRRLSRQRAQC